MKNDFTISEQGEVLILPDGKILAHNITPEIAAILSALDPQNDLMRQRASKTESDGARLCLEDQPQHWPRAAAGQGRHSRAPVKTK